VWQELKLIYVVIDGMGDFPTKEQNNQTPLSAAFTPNLDELAKKGKTGLMYSIKKGVAPQSDAAVISILGYDPFLYAPGRGILEAIGIGMNIKKGDLVLRCNYATIGENKHIIDRRVDRDLNTEEASQLSQTINKNVKLESHPATFELKTTIAYRAVLVLRSQTGALSSKITNTDPAYTRFEGLNVAQKKFEMIQKECTPIDDSSASKASAKLVNEFIDKSSRVLNEHEVNKNRAANKKLPANVILTRDAGDTLPNFFDFQKRYDVSLACLADMPVERGIAKSAGMNLIDIPSPSGNLRNDCLLRVKKLVEALPNYDCFYNHIKGPDEPGHDGNFRLKKEMIATIDKYFLGELLPKIDLSNFLICVTADHATPWILKAHSDDPVPVLISGNKLQADGATNFSEKECAKGSLGIMQRGTDLMPLLIKLLKNSK
jgi:2,3-bisphosphoglycerate-independent phosphoglycerate mutase